MRKHKLLAGTVLILSMLIFALPVITASAREFSDVPITASYYTAVDKYYQQARSLLSEAGQDPDGDSGIVQMGEIIRQLKEQGKLSQ